MRGDDTFEAVSESLRALITPKPKTTSSSTERINSLVHILLLFLVLFCCGLCAVEDANSHLVHCRGVRLGACSARRTYLAASLARLPTRWQRLADERFFAGSACSCCLLAGMPFLCCGGGVLWSSLIFPHAPGLLAATMGRLDTYGAAMLLSEARRRPLFLCL